MCGIAGIIDFENPEGIDEAAVKAMASRLVHRGPDDEGYRFEKYVGLGHRRLKVIDLEGGAQPMSNEDGSIWIVYNGEIYNFKILAAQLETKGHRFASQSDTEVVIHAYEQWGTECLEHFNGMFAFALWDSRKGQLFIARDRLGIKPLFYTEQGRRLIFASELRALLPALDDKPEVDHFGLVSYLTLQYVPNPATILKGVKKLQPAHAAVFDENGFRSWRWWAPPEEVDPSKTKDAAEKLAELIDDSVRIRMVSDVPLGAFLSGGIDSSTIVAMMARHADEPVRTFQVAFEDPPGYDETAFARLAANQFGAVHERLVMGPSDLSGLLPKIAAGLGEPVADPALIPTYMVSKLAREHVTVALTGEGADELFAGYRRYGLERYSVYRSMVPGFGRRLFKSIAGALPRSGRIVKGMDAIGAEPGATRHLAWVRVFSEDELNGLIPDVDANRHVAAIVDGMRPYFEPVDYVKNPLKRTLRCDIGTWLVDDLLAKVDYMSMAHGLEARVPFLDHRLVEWALRLPDSEVLDGARGKLVLKRAARGVLPEKIINRGKWGFTLPLDEWFRGPCREFVHDILGSLPTALPINRKKVNSWLAEHDSSRRNHGLGLFSMLNLVLWLEKN